MRISYKPSINNGSSFLGHPHFHLETLLCLRLPCFSIIVTQQLAWALTKERQRVVLISTIITNKIYDDYDDKTNLSKCPERLVPNPGQVAAEREGRGEARQQQQAEAQQDPHLISRLWWFMPNAFLLLLIIDTFMFVGCQENTTSLIKITIGTICRQ